MKTYVARARRSGDWWAIEVPDVPGVFTQVRRLQQAEGMARDAIATMLGISPASVQVEIQPELGGDLARSLQRWREVQLRQFELQAEANDLAAGTAAKLIEGGYTLRDAGRVMGLSFQRVHQLTSGHPRRRRVPAAAADR